MGAGLGLALLRLDDDVDLVRRCPCDRGSGGRDQTHALGSGNGATGPVGRRSMVLPNPRGRSSTQPFAGGSCAALPLAPTACYNARDERE